jgi:UDP-3-O-[3-hydroxymyristoyl] N-acetylglucosamine deacetylase
MTPPLAARPQQTIGSVVETQGVGVHGGRPVTLRLEPAPVDHGIRFVRADLPGAPEIAVTPEAVRRTGVQRMTVLESTLANGATVGMTEHLLAACMAAGLTNLRALLDAPECPILDGSSLEYWRLIETAGLVSQDAPARLYRLRRPVCFTAPDADIVALPADRMRLTFFAEFRSKGLPDEQVTFELGRDDFASGIAPARTFAFYDEIQPLLDANLIQGGSLDCAIVLRDGRPMNTAYRLQNELARHKLLDLLGDLGVLGAPVLASISARKTGHALHHDFIALLKKELIDGSSVRV